MNKKNPLNLSEKKLKTFEKQAELLKKNLVRRQQQKKDLKNVQHSS